MKAVQLNCSTCGASISLPENVSIQLRQLGQPTHPFTRGTQLCAQGSRKDLRCHSQFVK